MIKKSTPLLTKSIDFKEVPNSTPGMKLPVILLGLVIDFKKPGQRLDMDITDIKEFKFNHKNDPKVEFNDAIKYILKNKFQNKGQKDTKKMRIATKVPVYVAIKLSDDTDWQYMKGFHPFHLPKSGNKGSFYDAELYVLGKDDNPKLVTNEAGVRLAVMKYYPPNPIPTTDYGDRFNINTECIMTNHKNNDQMIPIIFDPEVGWPQGTKP